MGDSSMAECRDSTCFAWQKPAEPGESGRCAGLAVGYKGECPFRKTREQKHESDLASIRRRQKMGMKLTPTELRIWREECR